MAVDIKFYKVPRDIAQRAGVMNIRYRTKDSKFILDNKDLLRVRMTSDEIENGLQGLERITEAEALRLQAENQFRMGLDGIEFDVIPQPEEEVVEEVVVPDVSEAVEEADEPEGELVEAVDEGGEEILVEKEPEEEPLAETTEGDDEPEEEKEEETNENTEE